ncbi:GFA family protein [Halomonas sp. FeN2]|nr:GFA family protein [Halomonas sp. FeN2]
MKASLRIFLLCVAFAKHYFCSNCGIYTYHQTRSNPNVYGFNVGCLEGVNPCDLEGVPISEGINHESDL